MTPKDMPAVSIEGRTMLPMRQIATELGCEVVWNEGAQQVYVINDDYTLVFGINKNIGYQNGEEFKMDVPAMIVNDRTMLPVRTLATALDLDITWDDPSRTVNIATKKTNDENLLKNIITTSINIINAIKSIYIYNTSSLYFIFNYLTIQ